MNNKIIRIIIGVIVILLFLIALLFVVKSDYKVEEKQVKKPTPKASVKYEKNDFNFNIIKAINSNQEKENNYLISPYSIEYALSMLKAGANNNTKKELENAIGTRSINNVLLKDRINVANALFIKEEYKSSVKKDYITNVNTKYNANVLYDEFKTPDVINSWVKKETNGMIDKVLDEIPEGFELFLANALAIDVNWANKFDCNSTTSEKFTKYDKEKINTEMMHNEVEKYFKNENESGVVIPYASYDDQGKENYDGNNSLEFIGILPNSDIKKYINNLNKNKYEEIESSIKEKTDDQEIHISLPRFKYDYEVSDFKKSLNELGIKEVFNSTSADLSNIVNNKIYVSDAIHKTYIDLNESGTKAAAVTGLVAITGSMPEEKEIINIEFNKPFIYIIRDTKTKELLFFGVVYEPNKWMGSTCSDKDL